MKEIFDPNASSKDRAVESYGYTEAFLATIFAYGDFNQANYVRKHALLEMLSD